jgi:hypothetical protein
MRGINIWYYWVDDVFRVFLGVETEIGLLLGYDYWFTATSSWTWMLSAAASLH